MTRDTANNQHPILPIHTLAMTSARLPAQPKTAVIRNQAVLSSIHFTLDSSVPAICPAFAPSKSAHASSLNIIELEVKDPVSSIAELTMEGL
jgi:hypothetical protein